MIESNQLTNIALWNIVFNGLVAGGTLMIAILAIFGEKIKTRLFRPKLKISISKKQPFTETVQHKKSHIQSSSYLEKYTLIRFKVENISSIPIRNCQGLVQEIWRKHKDNNNYFNFKPIAPTSLLWCNGNKEYTIPVNIPSYLELSRLKKTEIITPNLESDSKKEIKTHSLLYLSIQETGKKGVYITLGKGTFIIPVIIIGDNIKEKKPYYFEVFWNGNEVDHLDDEHFYVSLLEQKNVPKEIRGIK